MAVLRSATMAVVVVGGGGGGSAAAAAERGRHQQQVWPVDYEAEVSQRLVEAAARGDGKAAAECLADAAVDVNYAGAVWLRSRRVEVALREEAPASRWRSAGPLGSAVSAQLSCLELDIKRAKGSFDMIN